MNTGIQNPRTSAGSSQGEPDNRTCDTVRICEEDG